MMGGGRLHHEDPMFLELSFGFCRVLKTTDTLTCVGYRGKENLLQDCYVVFAPRNNETTHIIYVIY